MKKLKLSELVALLEDETNSGQRELAELKGTMIVNFASDKREPKILNNTTDSAHAMFIKIIEYYLDKIKKLEKAND